MTFEFMSPHTFTRRVEFGDTDLAGIMHFANFFRFMEAAETDFLRQRGLSVSWSENGVKHGFPRVSVSCDYVTPLKFDELFDIDVRTVTSVTTQFAIDVCDLARKLAPDRRGKGTLPV